MSERSTQEQLIELQTQFAFQEDLLQALDNVVTRQQAQIDALERELSVHRDKLTHVMENLSSKAQGSAENEERPPHY